MLETVKARSSSHLASSILAVLSIFQCLLVRTSIQFLVRNSISSPSSSSGYVAREWRCHPVYHFPSSSLTPGRERESLLFSSLASFHPVIKASPAQHERRTTICTFCLIFHCSAELSCLSPPLKIDIPRNTGKKQISVVDPSSTWSLVERSSSARSLSIPST